MNERQHFRNVVAQIEEPLSNRQRRPSAWETLEVHHNRTQQAIIVPHLDWVCPSPVRWQAPIEEGVGDFLEVFLRDHDLGGEAERTRLLRGAGGGEPALDRNVARKACLEVLRERLNCVVGKDGGGASDGGSDAELDSVRDVLTAAG